MAPKNTPDYPMPFAYTLDDPKRFLARLICEGATHEV